jgi:hypothetical protein
VVVDDHDAEGVLPSAARLECLRRAPLLRDARSLLSRGS